MAHFSSTPFVLLGYFARAHGVRGEVSIHSFAESSKILLGEVFFGPPAGISGQGRDQRAACPKEADLVPAKITAVRQHHGAVLALVEGVADRDAAEALRHRGVYIARSKLPRARKHEVYLHDLVGLSVLTADESGAGGLKAVGVIASVASPAGQELWAITTPDGKEVLFPAVPEFVESIDVDAGTVVIAPPPGLLELYTGEA